MRDLKRGEIYFIKFPYTFDNNIYPNGKPKFVLVLQEGDYFKNYDTVEVLLLTSEKDGVDHSRFITNVKIELGTTKLNKISWVCCSQPYPVRKELFEKESVWFAGKLSPEKLDKIDEALYLGLCMGLQHEIEEETEEEIEVIKEIEKELKPSN